jgi:hypothetical protein
MELISSSVVPRVLRHRVHVHWQNAQQQRAIHLLIRIVHVDGVALVVEAQDGVVVARALRDLLDDAGPDDWDDLVACYRALRRSPKTSQ